MNIFYQVPRFLRVQSFSRILFAFYVRRQQHHVYRYNTITGLRGRNEISGADFGEQLCPFFLSSASSIIGTIYHGARSFRSENVEESWRKIGNVRRSTASIFSSGDKTELFIFPPHVKGIPNGEEISDYFIHTFRIGSTV